MIGILSIKFEDREYRGVPTYTHIVLPFETKKIIIIVQGVCN